MSLGAPVAFLGLLLYLLVAPRALLEQANAATTYDGSVGQGLVLAWPVQPDSNAGHGALLDLGQAYEDFDSGAPNQYHTGIDIYGVVQGTAVYAAAAGYVTKIQDNDIVCRHNNLKNPGGPCYDHGLGNTIIIKHVIGSLVIYTQYSHLNSVPDALQEACGPMDPTLFRRLCSGAGVPVDTTTQIGTVGGSGYGCPTGLPADGCPSGASQHWPNYWPVHLHFEVKDHGYLGDSSTSDELGNWGYTPSDLLPDNDGYHDPVLSLATTSDLNPALSITTTAQDSLRVGPGALNGGGGEYRILDTVPAASQYTAIRYAPGSATRTATCRAGWYEVSQTPTGFPDPSENYSETQLAYIPNAWVCADFVSSNAQPLSPHVNITPSQGNQGVTVFAETGTGFSPRSLVTQNISNGTQMTILTTDAGADGSTSSTFSLTTNPGSYTETDVDDLTGSRSNTLNFTVLAPALSPPYASTSAATLLASSSATLNGEVDPGGLSGYVYFYWGTSASDLNYMQYVGNVAVNSNVQNFSYIASGLSSNTPYFYKIGFYNTQSGTYLYGAVQSFSTLPVYVTAMWPSSITSSGAALNGTVNPEGSSGYVYFYWGTDPTNLSFNEYVGNVDVNSETQHFSLMASDLSSDTTYYYQAVFYNTINGSLTRGAVVSFGALPTMLQTLAPDSLTSSSAILKGTVNPEGSTGYVYFYWGTSSANLNNNQYVANVTANYIAQPFSFTASGLLSNTTYYYEIAFYDTVNGTQTYGPTIKFTVLEPVLTTLAPGSITSSGAMLKGTVNPEGSTGYVYFYWGTSSTNLNNNQYVGNVTANYSAQPFSSTVSGLSSNTTYYYEIVFYDTVDGIYTYGSGVSFSTSTSP